jgi:hypothetical protein
MPSLAIIIPIYNPHNDWFEAFCESIDGIDILLQDVTYSIVLVNDGSTMFEEPQIDNFISKTNTFTYLSYSINQGKGYAIRYGLSKSQADYYIYTDIDFPFGYEVIQNIYRILSTTSTNLVIGLRDKEYFNLLPLRRKIISRVLHQINFVLTGFKVHDTQAGIKGFNNEAKNILLSTRTNGFLFDLEFIRGCIRKKLILNFIQIHPRFGIKFSEFRPTIIIREFINLIKILFQF